MTFKLVVPLKEKGSIEAFSSCLITKTEVLQRQRDIRKMLILSEDDKILSNVSHRDVAVRTNRRTSLHALYKGLSNCKEKDYHTHHGHFKLRVLS